MSELKQKRSSTTRIKRVWRIVRPIVIALCSISITYGLVSYAYQYLMEHFIYPVDAADATPITVVVEKNDSASGIANKLYQACGYDEPGLINNKAVFKIYVDFVGKSSQLKAGTYILSKNMDIPQIVDLICAGNPEQKETSFTVQEGYTINGVLWSLANYGVIVDEDTFLALCNDQAAFEGYPFIQQLPKDSERDYILEGYLFPDTYRIYVGSSPETIIKRMLQRFSDIFDESYAARAQELGMTIDEVVTLASIIEREAAIEEDFAKVSAAFHNRLNAGQKLESCATLQYVLKVDKYQFTAEETATESPYNTYWRDGLPAGPISNPSKLALTAALWPNEEYIEADYRYFCNRDVSNGNTALIFSKTFEEHQQNIAQYQEYWTTSDSPDGGGAGER